MSAAVNFFVSLFTQSLNSFIAGLLKSHHFYFWPVMEDLFTIYMVLAASGLGFSCFASATTECLQIDEDAGLRHRDGLLTL